MRKNEPVEVRSRYQGEWTGGFDVVEEGPTGYRVRRTSDGMILPAEVPTEDVRAAD
jgi:hypothetical protein